MYVLKLMGLGNPNSSKETRMLYNCKYTFNGRHLGMQKKKNAKNEKKPS